jgi:hypothetical protein
MAHTKHTNFIRRWGNEADLALWYKTIQAAIDKKTAPAMTLPPHLDTCALKYGGPRCTCGLLP